MMKNFEGGISLKELVQEQTNESTKRRKEVCGKFDRYFDSTEMLRKYMWTLKEKPQSKYEFIEGLYDYMVHIVQQSVNRLPKAKQLDYRLSVQKRRRVASSSVLISDDKAIENVPLHIQAILNLDEEIFHGVVEYKIKDSVDGFVDACEASLQKESYFENYPGSNVSDEEKDDSFKEEKELIQELRKIPYGIDIDKMIAQRKNH
jgi:hypothetical protein